MLLEADRLSVKPHQQYKIMTTTITLTGPGNATVTDTAVDAILAQTAALATPVTGSIAKLQNVCAGNALNSIELKNEIQVLTKSLRTLQQTVGSIAVASAGTSAILAMQAANQIQTNNFQVQATKEALERTGQPVPVPPPIAQQIKKSVEESAILMQVGQAEGFVTTQITTMSTNMIGYVGGFIQKYTSQLTQWFKDKLGIKAETAATDTNKAGKIILGTPMTPTDTNIAQV